MFRAFLAASLIALPLVACQEGPAESAGKKIDKVGQNIRDTVDPPKGPAERLGRSIDRTF